MNFVFGPVPSRRLGRSLGVNNIAADTKEPPKICTYACIYCQLGHTLQMQITRQAFYAPEDLVAAVREKITTMRRTDDHIDYITVVPDGEPTLDINLGRTLAALKPLGFPLAVITNASLIWQPEVRAALAQADWVSLKVDAVMESVWRKMDRPHGKLQLSHILGGVQTFARDFQGQLVTETMLVADVNNTDASLTETAAFIGDLHPATAYISVPTRPPAEPWVRPPDEATLNRAYQIFAAHISHVTYLIGYEGNAFAASGDAAADLLSITAVHPMREDAVGDLLARDNADWSVVKNLVAQDLLVESTYQTQTFYTRKLSL
jgi:wyosine [tRNA(Phe)-imidazoG37] synthetase (radical SAM superfamily)